MTLKDIALEAGVSTMTVSNVINNKHERVSAATVEKVNSIVEKYNYIPNQTARSLTAKSSKIIAIIVPLSESADQKDVNLFGNPYIYTMLGIIEQQLRVNGFYPMIRSASSIQDINQMLRTWNVDGALFLLPEFATIDEIIENSQQPLVFLDSNYHNPDILSVSCDDYKGLYLSTKYLIGHGHTKIAFVGDYHGNPLLTQRFMGYQEALKDSGIPRRAEYVIEETPNYNGGIAAGKFLSTMPDKATGVVTTADICALGIMEGARQKGMRIPVDLSIVGFDNLELCNYCTPKLTTVSQHIDEKADTAVQLLLECIADGSVKKRQIKIDVAVIERQSVVSII